MTITVGIDIGVTGAVSALSHTGKIEVHDIPTMQIGGDRMVRRSIDQIGLRDLLLRLVPAGEVGIAVIEDVHSMPRDSKPGTFAFGQARATIETVLKLLGFKVRTVQPQTWKAFYGLFEQDNGTQARECAMRLYPVLAHLLARVKDHNRADSALLAHYGLRRLS